MYMVIGFIFAASIGAFLRYQAVQFVAHPWGTFLVNAIGSLLIGFLAVYLAKYSLQTKTLLLVAFLGSITTFSSYSLEVVTFLEEGLFAKAGLYLVLSNTVSILGCFLGWKLAHNMVITP